MSMQVTYRCCRNLKRSLLQSSRQHVRQSSRSRPLPGNQPRSLTRFQSTVTVPENVPVVTPVPASKADLTAGKKVFIVVTPGASGVYDAHVLFVEKDGLV